MCKRVGLTFCRLPMDDGRLAGSQSCWAPASCPPNTLVTMSDACLWTMSTVAQREQFEPGAQTTWRRWITASPSKAFRFYQNAAQRCRWLAGHLEEEFPTTRSGRKRWDIPALGRAWLQIGHRFWDCSGRIVLAVVPLTWSGRNARNARQFCALQRDWRKRDVRSNNWTALWLQTLY